MLNFIRSLVTFLALAFIFLSSNRNLRAATGFPVGPITFGSNAEYDNSFKEDPSFPGAIRNSGGYLELADGFGSSAVAVFDLSANGGSGGAGGTGGSDANNDLGNVTVSADFTQADVTGSRNQGFLLRLNNSENNGYRATFSLASSTQVRFRLFEGTGFSGGGTLIFDQTVLAAISVSADTYYSFAVTANGSNFNFDFASGGATASFTDTTPTATSGQTGFLIASQGRLDNFKITTAVPEPSAFMLCALVGAGLLIRTLRRFFNPNEALRKLTPNFGNSIYMKITFLAASCGLFFGGCVTKLPTLSYAKSVENVVAQAREAGLKKIKYTASVTYKRDGKLDMVLPIVVPVNAGGSAGSETFSMVETEIDLEKAPVKDPAAPKPKLYLYNTFTKQVETAPM